MGRRIELIAVIICLGVVVLWGNSVMAQDLEQGHSLYEQKCMICHGAGGKGDGPAASALSKHPADFNKPEFWQGDFAKKITDVVRSGHTPMPAFDLSDNEINAIVGYMEHAFKK